MLKKIILLGLLLICKTYITAGETNEETEAIEKKIENLRVSLSGTTSNKVERGDLNNLIDNLKAAFIWKGGSVYENTHLNPEEANRFFEYYYPVRPYFETLLKNAIASQSSVGVSFFVDPQEKSFMKHKKYLEYTDTIERPEGYYENGYKYYHETIYFYASLNNPTNFCYFFKEYFEPFFNACLYPQDKNSNE